MTDINTLHAPSRKSLPKLGAASVRPSRLAKIVDYDHPELSNVHLSLNDTVKLRADYNDGYDRQADYFTYDALGRYIAADRDYYAATGHNMQIHSGTRTVGRQAQLYVEYRWHKIGNPAAWPGCSFHNWGVAADMIRVDEANVIASMQSGGWRQTVVGEDWHFECVDSPDHARASHEIASFRTSNTGLAYQWSEQVALFYSKSHKREERAVEYQKRFGPYQERAKQLQAELDMLNQAWTAFNARESKYNDNVAHYEAETSRAQQLYDEIIEMADGPERAEKIREYKELKGWISEEGSRLQGEYSMLESERSALDRQTEELNQRIEVHKQETAWFERECEDLESLANEIVDHEANSNNLLQRIENAVATGLNARARVRST